MKRHKLEHIIRAAATIADDNELIIVGSQSILGQHPDAAGALAMSMEAARRKLAKRDVPLSRLACTNVPESRREVIANKIRRDFFH